MKDKETRTSLITVRPEPVEGRLWGIDDRSCFDKLSTNGPSIYEIACTLFSLVFTLYLLSTILCPLAFAVEVQPVRLELTVPHDQLTHGTLQITNHHASKAIQVQIKTGPYRFLQENVAIPSAESWFSFEPAYFSLGPQASTTVSYTITPPANVINDTAGEYLAAILVDELPLPEENPQQKGSSSAQITVVPRFALPVYLKIRGRELIQVEIAGLSIKTGKWTELLEVDTLLRNQGTVHVRLTGTVVLLTPQGGIAQTTPLGKAIPLLPTASMQIPTIVPIPSPGRYKAVVTVEVTPDQLMQKELSFEVTPENKIIA